ncbi:MAG TPA: hypothetical protein VFB33_00505 [Candidatus Binataceae bacterium]|jgi:hypothetical protein|nr:hypothetical protein [Candidatus Binataceae bacterium]
MRKTQWLYGLLVFTGGLAGGIVSGAFWRPSTAVADTPKAAPPLAQRVVTATEFVLDDPAGKPRARMSVGKDGQAAFAMYDRDQHLRAEMLVTSQGVPQVQLYDTASKLRIALDISTDGVPTVRLMDKDSVPRALFGVDGDGEPGLNFYARDGKLMRELP